MTQVQTTLAEPAGNPGNPLPVDGTVISYRVAAAEGTFAVQALAYAGDGALAGIVATSTPTPISSGGVSPPIATNLAIHKGDYLGIRNSAAPTGSA